MSRQTEIITASEDFVRHMQTNSTAGAVGAMTPVDTEPVTVEGTSVVFTVPSNLVKIYIIGEGADNAVGTIQLAQVNKTLRDHRLTISGITQASPAVVTTSAAHGLTTGDRILIEDVVGMTELNDKNFLITKLTNTTFSIGVDSSEYTAYSSGGTALAERHRNKATWLKEYIGKFLGTLSVVVGPSTTSALKSTERVCDTIAADGAYNTGVVSQIWTPASISPSPGYILLDGLGGQKIEVTFDRTATGTPTNMNILTKVL